MSSVEKDGTNRSMISDDDNSVFKKHSLASGNLLKMSRTPLFFSPALNKEIISVINAIYKMPICFMLCDLVHILHFVHTNIF
jgi:hypothetical protein